MSHEFDLLGSRDVIGHVTIRLAMGHFHFYWWSFGTKPQPLSLFFEIYSGECDAMIDMTLNDL